MLTESIISHGSCLLALAKQEVGQSATSHKLINTARNTPGRNFCHCLFLLCGGTPRKTNSILRALCLVAVALWGPKKENHGSICVVEHLVGAWFLLQMTQEASGGLKWRSYGLCYTAKKRQLRVKGKYRMTSPGTRVKIPITEAFFPGQSPSG